MLNVPTLTGCREAHVGRTCKRRGQKCNTRSVGWQSLVERAAGDFSAGTMWAVLNRIWLLHTAAPSAIRSICCLEPQNRLHTVCRCQRRCTGAYTMMDGLAPGPHGRQMRAAWPMLQRYANRSAPYSWTPHNPTLPRSIIHIGSCRMLCQQNKHLASICTSCRRRQQGRPHLGAIPSQMTAARVPMRMGMLAIEIAAASPRLRRRQRQRRGGVSGSSR